MSSLIASSPTRAPVFQDRAAADHADRGRAPRPSRILVLVEALAFAGASIDPTAALAARRLARIRDLELRHGRR